MTDTIAKRIAERELRGASLCQILHWLAQGRTTSLALAHTYLDAIAHENPHLNACFAPDVARVLEQAQASDARRAAHGAIGRLDGIAVVLKDNIDVAGIPSRCGLPGSGGVATHDACLVERLHGAGAVILAKTGMDEVFGADGRNPHHGDIHNPWRLGYSPGGSSAGAAAAVAAGLCGAAIGTDTLGSVRIPASYCGVFAFKPTAGEISMRGVWPAARRLDSVGMLARSVDDLAVLFHVLAGYDAADPRSRRRRVDPALPDWEPGHLRMGVLDDATAWGADADVAARFTQALQALQHELPNRQLVDFTDFPIPAARRAALLLIESEVLGTFGDRLRGASPRLTRLLDYARGKSAADYVTADRIVDAAMLKARRVFAHIDVLVTPTTPQSAFAHDQAVPANQADFTAFANLAGCPALSLPMGVGDNGLPLGMQLIGPPGSDLRLLDLAQVCAAALDKTPTYPAET